MLLSVHWRLSVAADTNRGAVRVIDASLGFTCPVWVVRGPDNITSYVYACDNYTACAATGFRFNECSVEQHPTAGVS